MSITQVNPQQADDPRRALPSVTALLDAARAAGAVDEYGRELVTVQARELLEQLRGEADLAAESVVLDRLVDTLRSLLRARSRPIQRVINATGVFLHTNLGRAPLPRQVASSLGALLDAGCDLEVDLESGQRGDRNQRVNRALRELTGAPAAVVVNNNAAALVLALKTLAPGKEVIVSRGELVEIGGSFRIPDILRGAGCRLVEVGSTNRTRVGDYEAALTDLTGLLLKVYPSNFRIHGFTEEASIEELVQLAQQRGVPLLVDEGSGLLRPRPEDPFKDHGSMATLLAAGCDLVCGSGDKVLGGSQAGLLLGRADLIAACHKSPLYRALRPSRLVLVALGAVLERHRRGQEMPIDRLFVSESEQLERLERIAGELETGLQRVPAEQRPQAVTITEGAAYVGGGSAPEARIEGLVLALSVRPSVAQRLRTGPVPVVGRMNEGRLILDLRTVAPEDEKSLLEAVLAALGAGAPSSED